MTPPDRAALMRVMTAVHDSNGGPGTVGELNALRNCREMLAALEAAGVMLMPVEPTDEMICAGDEAIIAALNEHPADVTFSKGTPAARCHDAMVGASPYRSAP